MNLNKISFSGNSCPDCTSKVIQMPKQIMPDISTSKTTVADQEQYRKFLCEKMGISSDASWLEIFYTYVELTKGNKNCKVGDISYMA